MDDHLQAFKLKEEPFKISPDPRFLYMTPQHEDVMDKCRYTIQKRGGLIVIHGAIGMGKTTIVRHLFELADEDPKNNVGLLLNPSLKTENAFLQALMGQFDVAPKRSYAKSLEAFEDYMIESHEKGFNNVVIIDEAQKLTPKMMDVIHSLLNFESNTEKFLQIVLVGQNELADNVDRIPEIKSRVARFGDLQPLNEADTNDMIAFRWHIASAGKRSHPFSEKALEAIYTFSGGIPREINKLCHESLLYAFGSESDEVSAEMILDAAKQMRLTKEV